MFKYLKFNKRKGSKIPKIKFGSVMNLVFDCFEKKIAADTLDDDMGV